MKGQQNATLKKLVVIFSLHSTAGIIAISRNVRDIRIEFFREKSAFDEVVRNFTFRKKKLKKESDPALSYKGVREDTVPELFTRGLYT